MNARIAWGYRVNTRIVWGYRVNTRIAWGYRVNVKIAMIQHSIAEDTAHMTVSRRLSPLV